jgi:hypothetical protein
MSNKNKKARGYKDKHRGNSNGQDFQFDPMAIVRSNKHFTAFSAIHLFKSSYMNLFTTTFFKKYGQQGKLKLLIKIKTLMNMSK